MYCVDMRYVDANETNNIKIWNREYVHMVTYMLVKYIQYMHIKLTRTIMIFLFGNRVGRDNATQVIESWLWGRAADMMEPGLGWGHLGQRAQQERQKLLKGEGRRTRPRMEQESRADDGAP